MVRAPCCEKMGLKKGPWTPEEDRILVNYIQSYGHGNWRALPKLAGLLRCGKSCRLRWTNYLRPDIKRGNFTPEEEDTIIQLHEMLGNRWSAIAARLPGRTDNEIKNVWHTHLKKRLNKQKQVAPDTNKRRSLNLSKFNNQDPKADSECDSMSLSSNLAGSEDGCSTSEHGRPVSPQQCSSDVSSMKNESQVKMEFVDNFFDMDENFWSEVLSADNSSFAAAVCSVDPQLQFPSSSLESSSSVPAGCNSGMYDSMEYFWYNIFTTAAELPDLPQL